MSDNIMRTSLIITLFIAMPFGAGFGLAMWLSGREFSKLLGQLKRTIALVEKMIDEKGEQP